MRFKGLITIIIIGLPSLLATYSTQANESSANGATAPIVSLNIKPLACVVKRIGEQCQMTITANWNSNIPLSACLYQDRKSIGCWQQKISEEKQYQISLNDDMLFSIKTDQGIILAKQKIVINASTSTKYRRRLRSQWSFF